MGGVSQQAPCLQVGMETLATKGRRNQQRSSEGDLWRVQRGQRRTGLPLHTLSPTVLQTPTFRGRGHRPSGQRPPASSAGSGTTYGSKAQKSWGAALGEGPALSLPGPARQRRTPNAMSARHSFQEELSAKRSEISGRNLLGGGSPYLSGTQEPRQGCQQQQLGRRRRRRHPGPPRGGPVAPPLGTLGSARYLPAPGPPRAHVDPRLARAVPPPTPDRQRGLPRPARPAPRLRPAPTPAHSGGPCAHAS